MQTGEILNVPDAYKCAYFNPAVDRKFHYKTNTILCCPIKDSKGDIVGCVQAINKLSGKFDKDDEHVLEAFSSQSSDINHEQPQPQKASRAHKLLYEPFDQHKLPAIFSHV